MGKSQQMIKRKTDELRQNMFVIHQLVERDKKRSLSSTFIGEIWEILNPLINMMVMILVFDQMIGKGAVGKFPLYLLTGTTIYELFTSGTTMCLNALIGNKSFLIKTQLNRNVYVIQKIWLAFRNFLFSMLIYLFVLTLYRIPPCITWVLFIPDILLLLLLMIGVGKILAVINITFADITYFYKIFTLFLMYGSAIFYRIDQLSPNMQKCVTFLNPLYAVIAIARRCIMERTYPSLKLWLIVGGYASICYLAGTLLFDMKIEEVIAKI